MPIGYEEVREKGHIRIVALEIMEVLGDEKKQRQHPQNDLRCGIQ
jgi:hypothetical protein